MDIQGFDEFDNNPSKQFNIGGGNDITDWRASPEGETQDISVPNRFFGIRQVPLEDVQSVFSQTTAPTFDSGSFGEHLWKQYKPQVTPNLFSSKLGGKKSWGERLRSGDFGSLGDWGDALLTGYSIWDREKFAKPMLERQDKRAGEAHRQTMAGLNYNLAAAQDAGRKRDAYNLELWNALSRQPGQSIRTETPRSDPLTIPTYG